MNSRLIIFLLPHVNSNLIIDSDGKIRLWHYTSGKVVSTIEEPGNETNFISYRRDGLQFATGGSDVTLRIYDSMTSRPVLQLRSTEEMVVRVAHSNRLFCAKFHPTDPNLIVSGGWDNTVKVIYKE